MNCKQSLTRIFSRRTVGLAIRTGFSRPGKPTLSLFKVVLPFVGTNPHTPGYAPSSLPLFRTVVRNTLFGGLPDVSGYFVSFGLSEWNLILNPGIYTPYFVYKPRDIELICTFYPGDVFCIGTQLHQRRKQAILGRGR